MKRNVLLLLLAELVFYACSPKSEHEPTTPTTQTENDTYFHYSIWWAFVNKVFDAKLSVAEMEKKGEAGLGSFNVLNGEMVLLANVGFDKQF
jgi:acetolactate decarboxylase